MEQKKHYNRFRGIRWFPHGSQETWPFKPVLQQEVWQCVVQELGPRIPVLWLPQTVLSLVKKGQWNTLLLHMSWSAQKAAGSSALECLRWLQIKMNWPSQEQWNCMWHVRYKFVDRTNCHSLTEKLGTFLIQAIREHSDVIITHGGGLSDPQQLAQRQDFLEQALRSLEHLVDTLEKGSCARGDAPRNSPHSAHFIFRSGQPVISATVAI